MIIIIKVGDIVSNSINPDNLCMGCMSVLESLNSQCTICGFDINNYKQNMHQLKPYTILNGKYLVGKVLGEGGFGITYLGWDLNLDLKIALKEYYPSGLVTREITSTGTSSVIPFSGDKEEYYNNGLDKFVNEAKSLAKFYTLPGIVGVKDFFRENGTAYIVMEFIDGITLKQHLSNKGGKLSPDEVLELMKPLMKSLSKIHEAGIIHRDISPDNIMLTKNGDIKLLDFGSARDFISDGNKSLSVLLKPGYAPEEQYRTRGHQGPWTDVYAFCATIYKMITGLTPPESLERLSSDELVPPSKIGIILSTEVENALLKGLSVFEKDRCKSIDELYNCIYVTPKVVDDKPVYEKVQAGQEIKIDNTTSNIEQNVKILPEPGKTDYWNNSYEPSDNSEKIAHKKVKNIAAIIIGCLTFVFILYALSPKTSPSIGNTQTQSGISSSSKETISTNSTSKPKATESPKIDTKPTVKDSPNGEGTQVIDSTSMGNTASNLSNSGIAAQQGDWIFYRNYSDNGYLNKIRTDGNGNYKLCNDKVFDINVIGDWVYYSNKSDNSSIYKIHTDGSQRTKLNNDYSYHIIVIGNYIYYINESKDKCLHKMQINTKEDTKLTNDQIIFPYICKDWIYCINRSDGDSLYKISIDGSQKVKIKNGPISVFNVVDDWIYYMNASDFYLYKVRTDGIGDTNVIEDPVFDINIAGNWIYYTKLWDYSLNKVSIDGKQKSTLDNDKCYSVTIFGDWIYYENRNDNSLYRIHTDGTGRQKVSS